MSQAVANRCFVALLMWLVGCGSLEPCDPGEKEIQGACMKVAAASDAGKGHEDAGGCTEKLEDVLKRACKKDGMCNCAAPFCAIMPSASEGYCTVKGCDPDAANSGCPEGWSCFDLSELGVDGYEPFCVES